MSGHFPGLPRRTRLAAALAVAFALSADASAGSVTNCFDNGDAGDLRHVIAAAVESETIDVSACTGTISLKSPEIPIALNSLKIQGPGMDSLTLDADVSGFLIHRVFNHTGSGTLTVSAVTISHGEWQDDAVGTIVRGGCIQSFGTVVLDRARISSCTVVDSESSFSLGYAEGAGVFANKGITLSRSIILNNHVYGGTHGAIGGGIGTAGDANIAYSTISGNFGVVGSSAPAAGGGVFAHGGTIKASTISGNTADVGGGVYLTRLSAGDSATIVNSTISGNTGNKSAGGMQISLPNIGIYNSTITANHIIGSAEGAAGLKITDTFDGAPIVVLQSVLVAGNTVGLAGTPWDFSTATPNGHAFVVGGSHDLIVAAPSETLPGGTIGDCPLLGPLRDNGGLTLTHALYSHSAAIDAGNNVALDPATFQPYANDQRGSQAINGTRTYPRESGAADIGAYEVDKSDIVFNSAFEGCP